MTSQFVFSDRSKAVLDQVNHDLQALAFNALRLSLVDFAVIAGMRTAAQEAVNVSRGTSQTMDSRHLFGMAIDVAAYVDGRLTWMPDYYHQIAGAFNQASLQLNIPIVWGGSWHTLADLGHFELDRHVYPDPPNAASIIAGNSSGANS